MATYFLKGYLKCWTMTRALFVCLRLVAWGQRWIYKVEGATDYHIDHIYDHDTD